MLVILSYPSKIDSWYHIVTYSVQTENLMHLNMLLICEQTYNIQYVCLKQNH